jgi:hypothetical protein
MEIIRCLKRYLAREVYYLLNPRQIPSQQTQRRSTTLPDKQESIAGSQYTSMRFTEHLRAGPPVMQGGAGGTATTR